MITFEPMTVIDAAVFDRLYADSAPIMDAGSYPWHLFGPKTEEEKRAHILESFENLLKAPDGIGWQVAQEGEVLLICVGTISDKMITWILGLCGMDSTGSRAWLYDPSYATARNAFWTDHGVEGWIMSQASVGKDIYQHLVSKTATGDVNANVSIVPSKGLEGMVDIVIKPTT